MKENSNNIHVRQKCRTVLLTCKQFGQKIEGGRKIAVKNIVTVAKSFTRSHYSSTKKQIRIKAWWAFGKVLLSKKYLRVFIFSPLIFGNTTRQMVRLKL
jgi:hypothetical protein